MLYDCRAFTLETLVSLDNISNHWSSFIVFTTYYIIFFFTWTRKSIVLSLIKFLNNWINNSFICDVNRVLPTLLLLPKLPLTIPFRVRFILDLVINSILEHLQILTILRLHYSFDKIILQAI